MCIINFVNLVFEIKKANCPGLLVMELPRAENWFKFTNLCDETSKRGTGRFNEVSKFTRSRSEREPWGRNYFLTSMKIQRGSFSRDFRETRGEKREIKWDVGLKAK